MIATPLQRHYTLDHALALAQESLQYLNMTVSFQKMGAIHSLPSYLCQLQDHEQQLTFRGAGSGMAQEAKIKAIYEALEESILYRAAQNKPQLTLHKLHSPDENMLIPIAQIFPHSPGKNTKLANSTGIAIGASWLEALLHGINDWIERDAYGLFLLNTFIKTTPAHCVAKSSLPATLDIYIKQIEQAYNEELLILDITTDFGAPAFFVTFTRQPVPVQPSGLGASLCKQEALQQALFEALQARDRYNANTVVARLNTLAHYESYPLLKKIFQCDLLQLRNNGRLLATDWTDIKTTVATPDLQHQLNCVSKLLEQRCCSIYYDILFQADNGLALVYVLVKGAETFGMMREGMFIPIKQRGMEMLNVAA